MISTRPICNVCYLPLVCLASLPVKKCVRTRISGSWTSHEITTSNNYSIISSVIAHFPNVLIRLLSSVCWLAICRYVHRQWICGTVCHINLTIISRRRNVHFSYGCASAFLVLNQSGASVNCFRLPKFYHLVFCFTGRAPQMNEFV